MDRNQRILFQAKIIKLRIATTKIGEKSAVKTGFEMISLYDRNVCSYFYQNIQNRMTNPV